MQGMLSKALCFHVFPSPTPTPILLAVVGMGVKLRKQQHNLDHSLTLRKFMQTPACLLEASIHSYHSG